MTAGAITHHRMVVGDGHRVAYRAAGAGPWALVCVHGLAQSGLMWEGVITRLPDGFAGYALDLLGFGDSDQPQVGYSIETHAASVQAFIDRLGASDVVLAGNSLGGVVALRAALRPPAALRALVLVATGPRVRDPQRGHAYREKLAATDLDLEVRRGMARGYCHRDQGVAMVDRIAAEIGRASKSAILDTMASSLATNLLPELPEVRLPTLVIQGREDQGRPPEDGLDIIRGIPDAGLVVLPHAGHTPMLDTPREFQVHLNAVLAEWMGAGRRPSTTAPAGEAAP